MSINVGELVSTTLEYYEKSIADNIFKDRVLLNHFKNKDGIKLYDGGRKIRVPLMGATNSTVMPFSGTDSLDLTYQDTVDSAEYDYKMYNVSITFTKEDELKNSGRSQVLDLLEAKIMQAENSISERINNDMFNGAASNAKEITGLDTAVGTTGTYGGISGTTYDFWRSYVDSDAETLSIADIRTAINTANLGQGGKPATIIVTTQTLYEKIFSLLTGIYSYNNPVVGETKRLGEAGFSAVSIDNVPVVFDEDATSGTAYVLNTYNIKMGIHKDANFKVIKKSEPTDQHLAVSHILFMGQIVVNRRASLAKLTNKTA